MIKRVLAIGAALAMSLTLVGCVETYEEVLKADASLSNVRKVPRGYIMYEIEDGTVTCREHTQRTELTCWKK
jgi:hypothetical protein